VNEFLELVRRTVREELARRPGPQLAVVTSSTPHGADNDTSNMEVDIRLKHDGLEIPQVPVSIAHVGFASLPKVGDLVLVEFVDHDLQQPLVTGRFYHDQERSPLHKAEDILFEHRLPDGKVNQMRFGDDGSIVIQRDVTDMANDPKFKSGIRIDPEGVIELQSGTGILLTLDPKNGKVSLACKDTPVEVTATTLTIDADVTIKKTLTVEGDGKISQVSISGTKIKGGP